MLNTEGLASNAKQMMTNKAVKVKLNGQRLRVGHASGQRLRTVGFQVVQFKDAETESVCSGFGRWGGYGV